MRWKEMASETVFVCTSNEKELWRFDGATFEKALPKHVKRGFCGSVLPVDAVHSHTFKIPIGTSEEKLGTVVEITMFEEGGLDLEKEYAIDYVKYPLDFESSWLIEAFAVSHEDLHARYDVAAGAAGHIDWLAVPFLVYESLYVYDKADSSKVELFLHLGDGSSFAVLCKEGRYITHRRLPSLESMALKANVSVDALKEALRQRGLEREKYGPDETLLITTIQDGFVNIVERVAQTVNHKRGIFGIGNVDTILIDFEQETIPGLWELFDSYGFSDSRKGALSCCETLDADMQHRGIEGLYLLAIAQEKLDAPNLTIFEKRPGFFRSHTGRFVAAVGIASLITGGAGLFGHIKLDTLETKCANLETRLMTVQEKSKYFRKKLREERARRDMAAEKLEKAKQTIMAFDEAADTMMLINASKEKRQGMMRDVVEAMQKYRLSATSMEQNGSKRMKVDVLTSYAKRERIAKFMKDLVDKGYKGVGTKAIRLDEDVYQSTVEIVR